MGLLFAIILIYGGAPLGLIFVLIGAVGMSRRSDTSKAGWPGLLLVVGVILLIAAGWMFYELSNTNFGL